MLTNFEIQTAILKAPCLKYGAIIATLYQTGARNMELRHIKLTDVMEDSIRLTKTKSGRTRMVPMPAELKQYLKNYMSLNRTEKYLFEGERPGEPIAERTIQYIVKECFMESANPAMTPHMLRHHFITHLVMMGKSPMDVKVLAGHARLETTEHYFHVNDWWLNQFNLLDGLYYQR